MTPGIQFAPTEGLCPFLQFTLYCSLVANRRMWTLSTSVVPSGWFAGVFLFSVTVSCPFPSRFFGQSLSCATGEHCWTMLTSEVM